MKITIEIPEKVLQQIVDTIKEYSDIVLTVEELKANPKLEAFFQSDLDTMYFEEFLNGLDAINFVEDLGLEKA
ncbi:hypothetical protein LCGC14_1748330 [marine sediment metagenome]|uniref:Uncharacterized protein n=1 Tax=marine sediment metagenome TaxID=412755 RepID=A0A0F9H4N7_9ZZZZ